MQINKPYLNQYFGLITSFQIQNKKTRWICQSAYNYFYEAYYLLVRLNAKLSMVTNSMESLK